MAALLAEVGRVDTAIEEIRRGLETPSASMRDAAWPAKLSGVRPRLLQGAEKLRFERHGMRIEIEVIYPEGQASRGSRLVVKVPGGSELDIETVSAAVTVKELSGDLEVESVSGEVQVAGGSKEVEIQTVSGDIDVLGTRDVAVEAQSVSGDVSLRLASGEFDVATVSGALRLQVDELTKGDGRSVSGGIAFDGDLGEGCRLDLESYSGDIDLVLPAGVSGEVELESYSGHLRSEFGDEEHDREWEFTLGDGEAKVEAETFSGDIEVKKKG